MASSGMVPRVAFVRIDVSKELSPSIIIVTRIGELGKFAVPPKRQFLQEPHSVASQKTLCFITNSFYCFLSLSLVGTEILSKY
jgi:hypothetical protein